MSHVTTMTHPCKSCQADESSPVILIPKTRFTVNLCPACTAAIRKPRITGTREELEAYLKKHPKVVRELEKGTTIRKIAANAENKTSETTVLKVKRAMKALKQMKSTPAPDPMVMARPAPPPVTPRPAPTVPDDGDDDEEEFDTSATFLTPSPAPSEFTAIHLEAQRLADLDPEAAGRMLLNDGFKLLTEDEALGMGWVADDSVKTYGIPGIRESIIEIDDEDVG